jgi:hypothetical protein
LGYDQLNPRFVSSPSLPTLMFDAEATIPNPGATNGELMDIIENLDKVRHAQ